MDLYLCSAFLVYRRLNALYKTCHIHPLTRIQTVKAEAGALIRSDTALPIQSVPQYLYAQSLTYTHTFFLQFFQERFVTVVRSVLPLLICHWRLRFDLRYITWLFL